MSMLKCPECGARGVRPVWSVIAQAEVAAWCPTCDAQIETCWTSNPLGDLRQVTVRMAEIRSYRAADAAYEAEEAVYRIRRRQHDKNLVTLMLVLLVLVVGMVGWVQI